MMRMKTSQHQRQGYLVYTMTLGLKEGGRKKVRVKKNRKKKTGPPDRV